MNHFEQYTHFRYSFGPKSLSISSSVASLDLFLLKPTGGGIDGYLSGSSILGSFGGFLGKPVDEFVSIKTFGEDTNGAGNGI